MGATTTSALDLITGALRNINVLESAEVPDASDANDALQVLNDMLESWTIEKLLVFSSTENRFVFYPGKYQYTIGNYEAGNFTGTLVSGSNIISNVTVPKGVIVGSMITDVQASIPTSPPTTVTVIGTNTLTLSATALSTVATPENFTYTVPGDIGYDSTSGNPIPLPVRITNAFTRITVGNGDPMIQGLDYQIRIIPRDKYAALGLKGIAGPWPTDLYYDRTYPLGNLYFYPNPSMAGELHYWTDTILSDLDDINAPIDLPQGYARAIKTNLAIELAAEYGKAIPTSLAMRAKEAKALIKSLNAIPEIQAFFDQHILKSRRADAGFILHGGFYT
ncbi:MAG: hypothetical protein KGL39_13880 [Patescibacteria group bacterium]|nr:hypothetical protein [Patescibacteria group bacterium]